MSQSVTVHGRRWIIRINGRTIHNWTACEAGVDLAEIAGVFRLEFVESVPDSADYVPTLRVHDRIEIEIASVVVLRGFVEALNVAADERSLRTVASGRDITGDLVDCAANPTGPAEYRQILLETVVGHLTQPFGISIDRQIETGTPFTLVALEPSDTVLGAIERLSRQRGVLVTSDGVSGLILTKAGQTRAQDRLVWPGGNVQRMEARVSQRHSDTWVKGQFNSLSRGTKGALNASSAPSAFSPPSGLSKKELGASCKYGHCVDADVRRYRPIVHLAKSQSGGSVEAQDNANPTIDNTAQGIAQNSPAASAYRAGSRRMIRTATAARQNSDPWTLQDQALWRMRTARAHATAYVYTVPGVLNAARQLWRANQLVAVRDLYNGIDGDMLIGAVTWVVQGHLEETRISVVPPDAYDLTGEADAPAKSGRRSTRLSQSYGAAT
ncbi:hypothetical protein AD945_01230 [Gluconobacter albidus]|uniref:Mu P family protein n=1 Tax=Gluconobacter albidus TaxID=318683 RepID=A0A149TN46_9PROT|nr:hypothetical protein [Gluconobacter albidus]KXV50826.1 hypothetical protein AD945_01230 [Gluconobacter albidus]